MFLFNPLLQPAAPSPYAHLQPIEFAPNQLLEQILSEGSIRIVDLSLHCQHSKLEAKFTDIMMLPSSWCETKCKARWSVPNQ